MGMGNSGKNEKQIRRRSSKACDQCRKSKCKCERSSPQDPCRNCVMLGTRKSPFFFSSPAYIARVRRSNIRIFCSRTPSLIHSPSLFHSDLVLPPPTQPSHVFYAHTSTQSSRTPSIRTSPLTPTVHRTCANLRAPICPSSPPSAHIRAALPFFSALTPLHSPTVAPSHHHAAR